MRIEMTWRDRERRFSIKLASGSRVLTPSRRRMEARIAGQAGAQAVLFEGQPLEIRF